MQLLSHRKQSNTAVAEPFAAGMPTHRIDYCQMGSVAFAPLARESLPAPAGQAPGEAGPGAGGDSAGGGQGADLLGDGFGGFGGPGAVPTPEGPFAVFSRCHRPPRLLAVRQREAALGAMTALAAKRLGMSIVGEQAARVPMLLLGGSAARAGAREYPPACPSDMPFPACANKLVSARACAHTQVIYCRLPTTVHCPS